MNIDRSETDRGTRRPAESTAGSETGTYRYNAGEGEALGEAVLSALGDFFDGLDATRGPPLYRTVDVESLDGLFRTGGEGDSRGRVSFTYEGHRVTATSDGVVSIREDASIAG